MNVSEIGKSSVVNRKVINALQILMSGQTLLFQGMPCGLCEAHGDSYAFYLIVNEGGHIVGNEMPFDRLYKWLNSIPDDEISLGLMGVTLQNVTRKSLGY